MGLLKSVIADARPAKSMHRAYTSTANVAGQLPAVLSSNPGNATSRVNRTEGFTDGKKRAEIADKIENQHTTDPVTSPHRMQGKRHSETRRQIKQGTGIDSRAFLTPQTTKHTQDSAKPFARATELTEREGRPSTSEDSAGSSLQVDSVNVNSSLFSSTERKPFQQKLQQYAHAPDDVDRGSSGSIAGCSHIETEESSLSTQIPIPVAAAKRPTEGPMNALSSVDVDDEEGTLSDTTEKLVEAKNANHRDLDSSQNSGSGEENGSRSGIRDRKSSTQRLNTKVTLNNETDHYRDSSSHYGQPPSRSNASSHAEGTENSGLEAKTAEGMLAAVESRLRNLDTEPQQKKDREMAAEVITAPAIDMTDNQSISRHVASQTFKKTVDPTQESTQVRIGQVDVFIDKPAVTTASSGRSIRPSISMASRHYLRRL